MLVAPIDGAVQVHALIFCRALSSAVPPFALECGCAWWKNEVVLSSSVMSTAEIWGWLERLRVEGRRKR